MITYENRIANLTTNLYKDFNTTLLSYRNASASNALPLLPPAQWDALNKTVTEANTKAKKQVDPKYTQSGEAHSTSPRLPFTVPLLSTRFLEPCRHHFGPGGIGHLLNF